MININRRPLAFAGIESRGDDNWIVLSKITLIQGVLVFTLLFAFAMSWHLIRLRIRVQSYAQLLAEANRQDGASST
ncbi:hypothetical protein FHR47_001557 [Xanthomonas arboricola]|uniref:hypothetical protein n=1 Tax=Xanthomonas cannabis TaxID=1885674 RepID=UPI0016115483|nr:hypothetical protein [Xanthomonas cannabis]MBB3801323.1 hypothetical protein [Xanthomonas cannabis]